jgi:hypothetical protein
VDIRVERIVVNFSRRRVAPVGRLGIIVLSNNQKPAKRALRLLPSSL